VDGVSQFQAVHSPRHLNICEKKIDIRPRFKNSEGIVGVHSFNRHKTGVFDDIHGPHSEHHFVFDNENFGRRMLQIHCFFSCERLIRPAHAFADERALYPLVAQGRQASMSYIAHLDAPWIEMDIDDHKATIDHGCSIKDAASFFAGRYASLSATHRSSWDA
jgi:hypothetical protein